MLGEVLQPALSKALNEAVSSAIIENMPPITEHLAVEGVIYISMSNSQGKQIVVNISDTIEPSKVAWHDSGSGRSSPLQIPLEKIQAAQQRFLGLNSSMDDSSNHSTPRGGTPVDLRAAYTSTPATKGKKAAQKAKLTPPPPLINGHGSSKDETPKTPTELQCKLCSQTLTGGLPALQSHTQEAHQRHVCRFCYNTFSLRSNLKRHERLHVGLKPFQCQLCSKSFAHNSDLKMHMQTHNASTNEDVGMTCTQCSRIFFNAQSLNWHLYRVHKATEATFACSICEVLFESKEDYNKHREDHANNLIQTGSRSTTDSIEYELNAFADDSDSEQLMIDTQSEGTGDEEEDISLPNLKNIDETSNSNDALSLSTKSATNDLKSPLVIKTDLGARAGESATPTPSVCSTGSVGGGSRKRKSKNPTRVIEIVENEEEIDMSAMYFDAAKMRAEKEQQRKEQKPVITHSYRCAQLDAFAQEEPENLVMKPRAATPPPPQSQPLSLVTPKGESYASNTLSKIAHSIQPAVFTAVPTTLAAGSPMASVDLHKLLTAQFLKQTAFASTSPLLPTSPVVAGQTYSPTPSPILITPERYQPSPSDNFAVYKQTKNKNGTTSLTQVTPTSKSKIENITDEQVDENKEYPCVEMGCNETYLGFSAYEDHCMIRHGRYPCKYCKQTFSGKNNRTRHMRCHLGAKTYTCPDCSKTFSRPDSMREHQFIHTLSYQEDKCRNCGAAFDKKNLLLAHLKQCYRHKMETGKSTKYIDETPAYLTNGDSNSSTKQSASGNVLSNEDALTPLKPIKLDNIPAFRHMSPTLDVSQSAAVAAAVAAQLPLLGGAYTATSTVSPSQNRIASPLNLSGGTVSAAASPKPIMVAPTGVNKRKSTAPRPVIIAPVDDQQDYVPQPIAVASLAASSPRGALNGAISRTSDDIKQSASNSPAPASPAEETSSQSHPATSPGASPRSAASGDDEVAIASPLKRKAMESVGKDQNDNTTTNKKTKLASEATDDA